uniref:Adhesion G-protein coupled receptor G2 n=1 Tax=Poecilia formosa TaxID=48698 RepID=A0A096MBY1_POEFO
TSTAPSSIATPTTAPQTSDFYNYSSLPQNYSSTVLQFNITTTAATTINGNDTTTMEAVINSNITTTAATATPVTENVTTPASATVLHDNATTTVAATTTLNDNKTTATTSKASISNTTVTAEGTTAFDGNITSTAASTTASKSNMTTTAAGTTAAQSNITTTVAGTTATQSNMTTTAAGTTAAQSNMTTTAAGTTAAQSNMTTTAAGTTAAQSTESSSLAFRTVKEEACRPPEQRQFDAKQMAVIQSDMFSKITVSNDTALVFQGMEVSCSTKTAISHTKCTIMLGLSHKIPSCCILQTLCAASKRSSDIHVVGNRIDEQSECPEPKIFIFNVQIFDSLNKRRNQEISLKKPKCVESGPAYVIPPINLKDCVTDSCSCPSYCNRSDAFYTFSISLQDPTMNSSSLSSLISTLAQRPNCSISTNVTCQSLATVASEYRNNKYLKVSNNAKRLSCRVILGFAREVSICSVAEAVLNVFLLEEKIQYDGQVRRAAICGSAEVNANSLNFQFNYTDSEISPDDFCAEIEESNLLTCSQTGENVVVHLKEQCVASTTTSPNVTNSPNVTSLNTTASPNVTSLNTTASPNVTSLNTTASPNVTSLNTTAESQAKDLLALAQDVSKLTAAQIDQLVSQLEKLLAGPTVSKELGDVSVNIVSNLLDASPDKLSSSSDRIIGIVDTVGLKLVIGNTAENLLYPSLAVSVKPADGANFQETVFSILDPTNVQVRGNPRLKRSALKDSSIPQGSITLPPSLTQNLTAEEQKLVTRLQFNFYQKSSVFKDDSLGQRKLNSGILGASVANLSIKGLQESVVIRLRNTEPVPANFVAVCVYWDFTYNKGAGGWNSDGCFVKETNDNETVCGCNHLTSFAILLDISRETVTSRAQATILTFITYIGCGLSAIFLSVTLLTYLAFGKLRKDIPSKILIQLCLALLLLNLVFLVDAWLALYPKAVGLCISTAWFLHYFLLVSFTWMGLEGVHMYYALVKVFNDNISHYMLKFSLVGWGVPMLVVIIVIAIDKNNYGLMSYGKFSDGTSDDFCWIRNDIAFYVAVVAYFGVIFIFNIIMFGVVLVQLHRIKKQNPHNNKHRSTAQDARSVIGITLLLGLTWGFAFFAWGPVNLAFMYLFAIFNSLQGFFIFVFHCAAKETVRRQWRTYLCCGSMRLPENSEWSRTATQKTAKKSPLTSFTSSQSSRPSRSTFLPSTPSGQMNGIGNPLEDRIITADEEPRTDVVLNEINRQQLRSRRGS